MSVSMGVVICFKTWMSSILRRGGGGKGGRGREGKGDEGGLGRKEAQGKQATEMEKKESHTARESTLLYIGVKGVYERD